MSWILLFHLLFWCHKVIFRETGYSTVFGAISRYWEQTLTIFDDVLLEEAVHAQLGHHARKSQKDWKNSQGMSFVSAVSSFLVFFHGIRRIYAKCVILPTSRINPSLKEWRFWYLIFTYHFSCRNFSFPVDAVPFHPVKDGEANKKQVLWKVLFSANKNRFCQSNLEEQRKSWINL